MKGLSEIIINQADRLVSASKSLDYKRIVTHDKSEVERLNQVLQQLSIDPARDDESLSDYAQPQSSSSAAEPGDTAAEERQKVLLSSLSEEGFDDRVGKIYNSFAKERATDFDLVPHKRGLPPFDLVMAPDFAPVAGMHGIFIAGNTILSIILPSDTQPSGDWQILKKKGFSSPEEMVEMVTLIAAGFDLP